ncbi:CDGSH iron-sulfur domain-containing protein 2 B [Biomphalaria glabrata]|uniref:Iron-binding zinc finger CDGSH type domain-containing protein n=1 Tax=Biomphalaria glabrata TaxID=6526 RepID=A0A2C9JTH4_BIOGL|nr:CDGSH iron-sulfur domain-containing protein 2-like protein B-like [Biomphalaria glabrata]KAI8794905.1 CDGSH iron-sulfur domain-containing protein 2 B [Biomphalaria glabrata]
MGLEIAGRDVSYIPVITTIALGIYVVWNAVCRSKDAVINLSVEKKEEKVVNSMDIEDIGDSIAFCRCWRSKKFPLCDGAHNAHNKKTGDNVGPMCLKRKSKS